MNYYHQLLDSYSLLKRRELKIVLEARRKNYSEIVAGNENLVQPISDEMMRLTGIGNEEEGNTGVESMKPVLKVETVSTGGATAEHPEGQTGERWVAQGEEGPIVIVSHLGKFVANGWKELQGQVARRLLQQNPNLQNPYKSSGRDILQDPILSDTAKTQEEQLHSDATAREIRLMSQTTLPTLIAAGFAGDPGRVTKADSDAPGWVKDPKNHLDSYSPQSLWSKVNNEKVTEIAKIIEEQGGTFKGEQANWEDKHEGVDSMHTLAKKCLKLQQYLDGDEGAFTDNDARWVHTNVILDSTNNKVRYNRGEIDGYGISFDHTTTRRSLQKETMSVGLARIYNKKIEDWVADQNKRAGQTAEEGISAEQFKIPDKLLTPEQLKSAKWCSDFRGKQAEKIVGFVPHILDISNMIGQYGGMDKRSAEAKNLQKEIARRKDILAEEMSVLFKTSEGVLSEAFKVDDWMKKGEILSDEYTEGITQTVGALKRFGKGEREIISNIFKRIVSNQLKFFEAVDSDFVFQAGKNQGPAEKADVFVTKLDENSYLESLKKMGVTDEGKRKRIMEANTKTLRELLTVEAGKDIEGLKGEKLDESLRNLLKSKKLYKHLDTTYDLDADVFTIPLSLKTYITPTDTRLGQTRSMTDTIDIMLDPNNSDHYRKNQDPERVQSFIKQNEQSLGIGTETGPSREEYETMMSKFRSIGQVGEMIKGDDRVKGMGQTEVARVVRGIIDSVNAAPSLTEKFLLDYLTKNFERDKEDGREAVRLASFVERALFEKAEGTILGSGDDSKKRAYRTMLASISMYTGMSADSTFAMEMDLLGNKSKVYNQDDCVKQQAVAMAKGNLPLQRSSVSNDWGNMSLKFERKGNSSVFGLKTAGCENIFKGKLNEDILKAFLEAQALLFEKILI